MSIIRKIADRIELYDPRTGERFFHYDETNDEVTADKPLNAGSVNATKINGVEYVKPPDGGSGIQDAIDKVNDAGGGLVFLEAGEFTIDQDISVYPNITVEGQGPGSTVVKAQSEAAWKADDSVGTLRNFTIRDFTFDGNNQGGKTRMFFTSPRDCLAENMVVKNAGARGGGGTSGGLAFRSGDYNVIRDCTAINCSHVSLSTQKTGNKNRIEGCTVRDPNPTGDFTHPLSMESNFNSRITNCLVIDPDNEASPAINANSSDEAVVSNNVVKGGKRACNVANATARHVNIVNNVFVGQAGASIQIQKTGDSGTVEEILVAENTVVDSTEPGVIINNNSHATIRNNQFIRCGNNVEAIEIFDPSRPCDIVGNLIDTPGRRAIRHNDDGAGGRALIAGNKIRNTNFVSISTNRPATIRDNEIVADSEFHYIEPDANDCVIENNHLGPTTVSIQSGTGHVIRGNYSTKGSLNVDGGDADTFVVEGNIGIPFAAPTVTLSTGAAPAGRAGGVHSKEGAAPNVRVVKPDTGTTPDSDHAVDAYPEWNNNNGEWDVVIEWQTDPGSDFDATVEIDKPL